jgi:phosphohistidine phosphatase
MILYLMRHGIALDLEEAGVDRDEDRPLSKEGVQKTRAVAAGLKRLECSPDRIISSPLLRAVQTAEIVQKALLPESPVEPADCLKGGCSAAETVAWLHKQSKGDLMLVGHSPHLPELAALLLCGDAKQADLEFKKAGVACLSFDGRPEPGQARLEWLLPPKILRRV